MLKQAIQRRVSRVVRYAVREAVDEARSQLLLTTTDMERPLAAGRVRRSQIDVEDALRQLNSAQGRQLINHFFAWNHRWVALLSERNQRTARDVYDFIDQEMGDALFALDQFRVLESRSMDIHELNGWILDLGVYRGASTRRLAGIWPSETIHGFDSFEGLPDDWTHAFKGDFGDIKGALPEVPANVQLHKGWFNDTLPEWVDQHPGRPISLLRIDCDIYSSTKVVFDALQPLIRPGTWVLFDELIGYRGWREHEYKALGEFLESSSLQIDYVAYGLTYVLGRLQGPSDGKGNHSGRGFVN